MRKVEEILDDIDTYKPVDGDWTDLEDLINELWNTEQAEKGIINLLKVMERFPDEDGDGVLWSIVHGIEEIDNYEQKLLDSLGRQPSHLGVLMIHRIENSNQTKICGKNIKEIYKELLVHPKLTGEVREDLKKYLTEK